MGTILSKKKKRVTQQKYEASQKLEAEERRVSVSSTEKNESSAKREKAESSGKKGTIGGSSPTEPNPSEEVPKKVLIPESTLAELKESIASTFGNNVAELLTVDSKWDSREIALKTIAERRWDDQELDVLFSVLRCTLNDKVTPVIVASHDCLLKIFQAQKRKDFCHELVMDCVLPKTCVQAVKIAKSAKAVLRGWLDWSSESTAEVIREVEAMTTKRGKIALGSLEVLDLVLRSAPSFHVAPAETLNLLRMGFQDGLGPKVRALASAITNRIQDSVGEDALQPLLSSLRPAVVQQIYKSIKPETSLPGDTGSGASGNLKKTKKAGGNLGMGKLMMDSSRIDDEETEDEALMDKILDDTGLAFTKSDLIKSDFAPGTAFTDVSTSTGGTAEHFPLHSELLV